MNNIPIVGSTTKYDSYSTICLAFGVDVQDWEDVRTMFKKKVGANQWIAPAQLRAAFRGTFLERLGDNEVELLKQKVVYEQDEYSARKAREAGAGGYPSNNDHEAGAPKPVGSPAGGAEDGGVEDAEGGGVEDAEGGGVEDAEGGGVEDVE